MSVQVLFFKATIGSLFIYEARLREPVTVPGTTVATSREDEIAVVINNETGPVLVAFGTEPDAAALSMTNKTSCGMPITPGDGLELRMPVGSKINFKPFT